MSTSARIFRRTAAGSAAFEDQNSGLPAQYRRILRVMTAEIHSDVLRALLRCYSETQLVENIDALLKYINAMKPASSKGVYVRNVSLSATMLPGITIAA